MGSQTYFYNKDNFRLKGMVGSLRLVFKALQTSYPSHHSRLSMAKVVFVILLLC